MVTLIKTLLHDAVVFELTTTPASLVPLQISSDSPNGAWEEGTAIPNYLLAWLNLARIIV